MPVHHSWIQEQVRSLLSLIFVVLRFARRQVTLRGSNVGRTGERTLNATRPTMTPAAKKIKAIISQINPQTLMFLSIYSKNQWKMKQTSWRTTSTYTGEFRRVRTINLSCQRIIYVFLFRTILFNENRSCVLTYDIPNDVHARHDTNE